MKHFKRALKFGALAVTTASTSVFAAEDAGIIAAVSGGITDAGDTTKAVYLLLVGAAIVIMAAAWVYSSVRAKSK